jgi:hypothetical protein
MMRAIAEDRHPGASVPGWREEQNMAKPESVFFIGTYLDEAQACGRARG